MQPNRLVAVDSNILFALAQEKEEVIDAWHLICDRLLPVLLVVSPTVLGELGDKAAEPETPLGKLALKALRELRARWNFQPVELRPSQEERASRVARRAANHPSRSRAARRAERRMDRRGECRSRMHLAGQRGFALGCAGSPGVEIPSGEVPAELAAHRHSARSREKILPLTNI